MIKKKTSAIIISFVMFMSVIGQCMASENNKAFHSHASINAAGRSWGIPCLSKEYGKEPEIFIRADSEIFKDLKILSSLSSSGKTLGVTAPGGDAYFSAEEDSLQDAQGDGCFIKDEDGVIMIPLRKLAQKANINIKRLEKTENGFEIELAPTITKIEEISSESSYRMAISLSILCEISQEEESDSSIGLFFSDAKLAKNASIALKSLKAEIKQKENGISIKTPFPENRKGFTITKACSEKASIEFLPSFNLSGGYASERLESVSFDESSITVKASGPFRYFWHSDKETGRMTAEIPMLSQTADISVPESLKNRISSYFFNSSYGILGISVMADSKFSFENPDKKTLVIKFGEKEDSVKHNKGFGITGLPEHSITIVIDPGHGGGDAGAVNKRIGVSEKKSNLELALELGRILNEYGYKTVFTRTSDRDVTWPNSPDAVELQARADIGNANSATVFLSVHCNASVNKNANGFAVYWTKEKDRRLAEAFKLSPGREVKDKGAIYGGYYVLRHANMPSVIIETLFISNDKEAELLKNAKFRSGIMKDCADSVDRFIRQNESKDIDIIKNK